MKTPAEIARQIMGDTDTTTMWIDPDGWVRIEDVIVLAIETDRAQHNSTPPPSRRWPDSEFRRCREEGQHLLSARHTRAECPVDDQLQELHDAALPADAPGAWVKNAIEKMRDHGFLD